LRRILEDVGTPAEVVGLKRKIASQEKKVDQARAKLIEVLSSHDGE